MKLLDYINTNTDWKDSITKLPQSELGIKFSTQPISIDNNSNTYFNNYINKVKSYKHDDPFVALVSDIEIHSHNQSGSISAIKDKIKFEDISTSYEFNLPVNSTPTYNDLCVLLSLDSGFNYFHWLCQILPRVKLLQDFNLNWGNISNILIPKITGNFVRESLHKLRIPLSKCLQQEESQIYKFKNLIIPSRPNRHIYLTKWSLDFLKQTFLKKNYRQHLKLYIPRYPAVGRSILNERELWGMLKNKGYKKIDTSCMSISRQAKLFNSASHIVAPHGASLANLSFCQPNTKVIEIFNEDYFTILYWNICNILNLKYGYLICKNHEPNEIQNKRKNIIVDMQDFKKIMCKIDNS